MVSMTGLVAEGEHLVDVAFAIRRTEPLLVPGGNPFPERLRFVGIIRVDVGWIRRGALVSQRFLVEAIKVKGNLEPKVLLGRKIAQKLEVADTVLSRAVSQDVVDPRGA